MTHNALTLDHIYYMSHIFSATCKGVTQDVWAYSGREALDHFGWTEKEVDSLYVEDSIGSGFIIGG